MARNGPYLRRDLPAWQRGVNDRCDDTQSGTGRRCRTDQAGSGPPTGLSGSRVFELEMERIFGRAWVYVGHDSQVSKPGDFVTTFIGREPVIFCRHSDEQVYVLHNRCSHRGASVCNISHGNTGRWFRCPYHGWTFDTDGRLHAVPMRNGYSPDFKLDPVQVGLARVPRVAQYKGFTFVSLAPDGAPFQLPAEMRACIDCIIERAPDKAIEVTGGIHKYEFRGNWKAQIENALDHYHPPFTHE